MTYTLEDFELEELLVKAAAIGAKRAFEDLTVYSLADTCKRLGITYSTLQRRIAEGKIKPIDGKVTGAEIARYLKINK